MLCDSTVEVAKNRCIDCPRALRMGDGDFEAGKLACCVNLPLQADDIKLGKILSFPYYVYTYLLAVLRKEQKHISNWGYWN